MDVPATAGLDTALRTLDDASGVVAAYLLGSVADRRAHQDSDLDVAVLLDWAGYPSAGDRFEARLHLTGRLGAAAHRNDVDIVMLNDVPHLARARASPTDGASSAPTPRPTMPSSGTPCCARPICRFCAGPSREAP